MVTNDRRFFWILEAVLGVLVLLTIAVMFSGKGEKDKIAVIVRNSDAEKWTQFISGVKAAASDSKYRRLLHSHGGKCSDPAGDPKRSRCPDSAAGPGGG